MKCTYCEEVIKRSVFKQTAVCRKCFSEEFTRCLHCLTMHNNGGNICANCVQALNDMRLCIVCGNSGGEFAISMSNGTGVHTDCAEHMGERLSASVTVL